MILHDSNAILLYIILQIVLGVVVGYLGARLRTWTLQRYTQEIDYRLVDLEARLNREVKIRAGDAGRNVRTRQKEFDEQTQLAVDAPTASLWPPWISAAQKGMTPSGKP